jgi:hypothetical protein
VQRWRIVDKPATLESNSGDELGDADASCFEGRPKEKMPLKKTIPEPSPE